MQKIHCLISVILRSFVPIRIMPMKNRLCCLFLFIIIMLFANTLHAQSEFQPWGNITGIRIHGQLFEFETSLQVAGKNATRSISTGKEKQRPHFTRDGNTRTVNTNIDSLYFKETVKDRNSGKAQVTVQLCSHMDTVVKAVYFCIKLPENAYGDGRLQLKNIYADSLNMPPPIGIRSNGIDYISPRHQLHIGFSSPMAVTINKDTAHGIIELHVLLTQGMLHKNDSLQKSFTIKMSGNIDRTPVNIVVDTSKPGRPFAGLGGNFRLQNPKFDPEVIDYCLDNLRVAWGRVELPWRFWQPNEKRDISDTAKLHPAVIKAMLMAQRLGKLDIPFILSAWFPPNWAILGKVNFRPVRGVWGNPLDPDKMDEIYKSITDYIIYLKEHYGVEASLFSFNESDLGINVRITPQEHDELIKGLGAYFQSHGLKTKMLLGDNSDANSYRFIYPALADSAAWRYIGAVSFHSWRGWDLPTLQAWATAAKQINKPLMVAEGSIDAQAWGYPQVFEESSYALEEISLYTRLLNICQPLSILQWQLTTDYSPLIGGGIFGNNSPLYPGQRFWNLKQLSSTPANLFAMPVSCNVPTVSCAALGDNSKGTYIIHMVNNGPKREIIITGLPTDITSAILYLTNKNKYMTQQHSVKISNGTITFKAAATSYYTFTGSIKR